MQDFNTDKLRQYKEIRKEMRKMNAHCMKYFGTILCHFENFVIWRLSIWRKSILITHKIKHTHLVTCKIFPPQIKPELR